MMVWSKRVPTMTEERKEELLDELFDAVSSLHHYMGGMLDDMKNKRYNIEEASADMVVFDNAGIGDILNELYELSEASAYEDEDDDDITTELPVTVDVWGHYGAKK